MNRVTATKLNETVSDFREVQIGVVHCSKRDPVYFIIYINDLLDIKFRGQIILYADYAVLTYCSEGEVELQSMKQLQHDMNLTVE